VPLSGPVFLYPGEPAVKVNHGATFLVAHANGSVPTTPGQYGLFADDTRYLSRHEVRLDGRLPEPLAFTRLSFRHARWHLLDGPVALTVDRLLASHRLHEDISLRTYGREPASLVLTLAAESDFADIFEVHAQRWQRRAGLTTTWSPPARLETRYRREDFVRRCVVRALAPPEGVTHANGALRFPVELRPGEEWHVCLQYDLLRDDASHPGLEARCPLRPRVEVDPPGRELGATRLRSEDTRLERAYEQAIEDFAALRLSDRDTPGESWVPAAGIPWFAALFGRDALIASLQAAAVQPAFALATLDGLARWQSTVDDPERDAEPGKMPHELRLGEWAHFGAVPHRPYYGTADATALYLLLLAEAYRWTGDPGALARHRTAAERCLAWIDHHGDSDGDGLQEWAPRTPRGYRNQCWRDSEEGVLDERGENPPPPIGTCELQAYVYGAKLRVAPLFDAWGDAERARRLPVEAGELRRRFLDAFWLRPYGEVAFALDGRKRAIRSAVSNPGHCLWMGILDPERGRLAGERLMAPDLFSGWGLRTLSEHHPAYDPHGYQRGAVWPHDTVIAAAGLRRYGLHGHAWRLLDGLLGAVTSFEGLQMPELFSGLPRAGLEVPVPHRHANVPQAWGAGAVLQGVRVLLGLEPDLPAGRLYVDPALPVWCPALALDDLRVGRHRVRLHARRERDGSSSVEVDAPPGLEVVRGAPPWLEPASPD
jgi:glycogen debranching enzyme